MRVKNWGMRLKSAPVLYPQSQSFNMTFLDPARNLAAPVLRYLKLRISLTFTTGTAGCLGRMLAQAISRVSIYDGHGEKVTISGAGLRVWNAHESGGSFIDPQNRAISGGPFTQVFYLRIPLSSQKKARRSKDFGLNLFELVDVGRVEILWNPTALLYTNGPTISAGEARLCAYVEDEGTRELKSRLVVKEYDITQTEAWYNVYGALRTCLWYNGAGAELTQAAWPVNQQLFSQNLEINGSFDDEFVDDYVEEQNSPRVVPLLDTQLIAPSSNDPMYTRQAIPIWFTQWQQSSLNMPVMSTLHIRTDQAVPATSPKVIIAAIQDRNPAANDRTLPGSSLLDADTGVAVMSDGNHRKWGAVGRAPSRILPARAAV